MPSSRAAGTQRLHLVFTKCVERSGGIHPQRGECVTCSASQTRKHVLKRFSDGQRLCGFRKRCHSNSSGPPCEHLFRYTFGVLNSPDRCLATSWKHSDPPQIKSDEVAGSAHAESGQHLPRVCTQRERFEAVRAKARQYEFPSARVFLKDSGHTTYERSSCPAGTVQVSSILHWQAAVKTCRKRTLFAIAGPFAESYHLPLTVARGRVATVAKAACGWA
jgi:hypothetical protein